MSDNKVTKNDITGDKIKTKPSSELYRHNWEIIFGNKNKDKNKSNREKNE